MKKISKTALLPYSAKKIYDLVNDVEAYPDFLPWCGSSKLLSSSPDEMKASITIAKAGMNKSFTTINRLQDSKKIEITLAEGPFKSLTGVWEFKALDNNDCKILLNVEFEVGNSLLNIATGHIFEQIASTLVDSFCKRAKQVYG